MCQLRGGQCAGQQVLYKLRRCAQFGLCPVRTGLVAGRPILWLVRDAHAKSSMPAAELHGERKQATVLSADIVGSTELIAGLDAEQAAHRLQPLVASMTEAVRRFGGTVMGKTGDGLKAIFGAPRALEGHALLACQAALAMQSAMASQPEPIPVRIRVGLHSGEVVAGADPRELEAQGITLHIASRLEQAADPGGILMSATCRELVGAYCDTLTAGWRLLKGIPAPVEVFRLIGLKTGSAATGSATQASHRSAAGRASSTC